MSKKPKEIKPIERYIMSGVCKMVKDYWQLKNDVKISTRDDTYDVFVQAPDKTPELPYGYLKLMTGGISPNSLRPESTARQGVSTRIANLQRRLDMTPDGGTVKVHMMSFIPYTFGLVFSYVTDDFQEVLDCVSRQSYANLANKLNFELVYNDVKFTINVKVDTEASFPQKSRLGNDVSAFQVDIQLTVEGYISSPEREDDYQVTLITAVNLDTYMGEHDEQETE